MSDNDEWYDLLMKMSFSLWLRSWEDKYLPRWLLERSTTSEESGRHFRWSIKTLCLSSISVWNVQYFVFVWNLQHCCFRVQLFWRIIYLELCLQRSAGFPATLLEYRAARFEKPIVNIRKGILEVSQSFLFKVLEYGHFGIWASLHRDWEKLLHR